MVWKTKSSKEQHNIIRVYENKGMGEAFLVRASRGSKDCGTSVERESDFTTHILPTLNDNVYKASMANFPNLDKFVSAIFESINSNAQEFFKERDGSFIKTHTFLLYLVNLCFDICTEERNDTESEYIREILEKIELFGVKKLLLKLEILKVLYGEMLKTYDDTRRGWGSFFSSRDGPIPGRVAKLVEHSDVEDKSLTIACE